MSGMLLLLQGAGRLVYIIPLPITMFSPGECGPGRSPSVRVRVIFTLDCGFGWSVTSLWSFPVFRRSGECPLYISGVLGDGDPVSYVIYCLFRTEYELICSFNTF